MSQYSVNLETSIKGPLRLAKISVPLRPRHPLPPMFPCDPVDKMGGPNYSSFVQYLKHTLHVVNHNFFSCFLRTKPRGLIVNMLGPGNCDVLTTPILSSRMRQSGPFSGIVTLLCFFLPKTGYTTYN